jgi:hypothetical protein
MKAMNQYSARLVGRRYTSDAQEGPPQPPFADQRPAM